jgi:hypothetical protein
MELGKQTPCEKIRQEYAYCLGPHERGKRVGRLACSSIEQALKECTAKHIGSLSGQF